MADALTSSGEALIVDILDGTVAPPTYWIGWGKSTGAAAKTDTILSAEETHRVQATLSQPAADKNQFLATLTASAAFSIGEVGVFSSSTAGIMVTRSDFTLISLALSDEIRFTITLQQT